MTRSQLAFALSRNQEYARAIDVLSDLAMREPRKAVWPYMVGYQHYMQCQWAESITWFEKALCLKPDYMIVLYRKGYAHSRLDQGDSAVDAFTRCMSVWESLPEEKRLEARKAYSDACVQLGKLYLGKGLFLKARRPLTVAVQQDPGDADKRYQLGKCLLAAGDARQAIDHLLKADAMSPRTEYIVDQLARAHAARGNLEEAERLYSTIPDFRRREHVWRNIGVLHYRQGRYSEAVVCLQRAARKTYDNHHTHYYLGLAFEALERWTEAHRAFEEAVRIRQRRFGLAYPEAEERLSAVQKRIAEKGAETAQTVDSGEAGAANLGIIEMYNPDRGFGFIRTRSGDKVFFHVSTLPKGFCVQEGTAVEFEVAPSPKGPRASNLRPVVQ